MATDGAGAATTSSGVSITVAPAAAGALTVTLTHPTQPATLTAPATIGLAATTTDSAGTVTGVDYYQGATLVGSSSSPPYTVNWNAVPAGTYALSALAHDSLGGSAISSSVTITVVAPGAGGGPSASAPSGGGAHCGLGVGVAGLLLLGALALTRGGLSLGVTGAGRAGRTPTGVRG